MPRFDIRHLDDLTPAELAEGDWELAVVVDVLRAFTVAPWVLRRGAEARLLSPDPETALAAKRDEFPSALRIKDGRPDPRFDLPGFDPHSETPTSEERQMALLAHLSGFAGLVIPFGNIVGPLVMWQVKKDTSPFVADQALEALNFQITFSIVMLLSLLLIVVLVGILTSAALAVAWMVLVVVAAIKANEGTRYRYPFTLRLVK